MNRLIPMLTLAAACTMAGPASAGEDPAKPGKSAEKPKGAYLANRAGWMMGMYIGEEKGRPYPFVLQVDPNSQAKDEGIRVGDELMKLDDVEGSPLSRVFNKINGMKANRRVTLWIRRGAQTMMFELTVPKNAGASPEETAAQAGTDTRAPEDKSKTKKKKDKPIVIKPIEKPGS